MFVGCVVTVKSGAMIAEAVLLTALSQPILEALINTR